MKLSTYLETHDVKPAAFAAKVGIPQPSMHRYVKGERFPRPEQLRLISDATGGLVTANDFLDAIRPSADEAAA